MTVRPRISTGFCPPAPSPRASAARSQRMRRSSLEVAGMQLELATVGSAEERLDLEVFNRGQHIQICIIGLSYYPTPPHAGRRALRCDSLPSKSDRFTL